MDITIKTKLDLGQEVYWMKNNRINKGVIDGIQVYDVNFSADGLSKYMVLYTIGDYAITANEVYTSKEEILADLITKSGL